MEANCICRRLKLTRTAQPVMCSATTGLDNESPLYFTCTTGVNAYVYLRNSFTKKEDETEDEEQHNYDHGHDNDHG